MGRHRENYAGDEGRPARREQSRARRRRGRGGAFVALAAAFAIILGLAITGYYTLNNQDGCGGKDIPLSVVASPELVPALDRVASDFNSAKHGVDGRCVRVEVRGEDSANVAYGITGAGPTLGDTDSDVWIPDSRLWHNIVENHSGGAALTDTGTSVAYSPLVLAQPAAAAEKSDAEPSWDALVPTAAPTGGTTHNAVRVVDPIRSASGMATLALISDAIGSEEEKQPQLVAALQTLQRGVTPDEEAAFGVLSQESDTPPIMVLSEQAAWRYNADHEDAPAEVSYPEGGTYTLDYPYIVRTEDPILSRAAETFRATLSGASVQKAMLAEGFRNAEGAADPDVLTSDNGFQEKAPESLPDPSSGTVERLGQAWNQLKLDTRLLTIVDISGSMLETVPGTDKNRMEVTTASAIQGLEMFPPESELGLWEFSTALNNELDYRELTPVRELSAKGEGGTHKQQIASALGKIEPKPTGDTGLYDTYLAAFREMSRNYKADRINAILMLTDGNNDDPNGISLDHLLQTLQTEGSRERPVPIFTIAFGPDIDPGPLEKVAKATGGATYTTKDPTEIGDIFLRAFAQRLKGPESSEDGE
ncbi:substrate-binding and VWA domain-containing protein [Nocardiopsis rhodophaea]|uniref:Substrate-binding and VWA domain-containing protein n=1 Tax=Nocardiopsis rhodophaea TaxID=280238 RepID=A0ABP5EQ62_9ACTN